jgi:hypothetical protein
VGQTVNLGQQATFSVVAGGSAPLAFQWLRNGKAIAGATTQVYVIPSVTLADNGATFQVVVSNPEGQASSHVVTLTVNADQPIPTITAPTPGTLYQAGQSIAFRGTATDPHDATLPPSAFTWTVDFHDGTNVVSVLPPTSGLTSGSFTIPTSGDTATDVFYRISLTVTDSRGASQTTWVDLDPRTATLTVATNPAGLQVAIDGQPGQAPDAVASVVGMDRVILAPATQILGGTIYQFTGWSDGTTAPQRVVTAPASGAGFLALYQDVGTVPPATVLGVQEKIRKGSIQQLIVSFDAALDPASAQVAAAYWLVLPGRNHRFGARGGRRIRVRAAVYNGTADTVTLTPRAHLSSRTVFQLVVSGSTTGAAVRDVWGRLIDGDHDGQPGGNDVVTLGPAKAKARKK